MSRRTHSPRNPLQRERLRLGLRVVDLAVRAGVSPAAIYLAESGYLRPKLAAKLAGALGVAVEKLAPTEAP